MAIVSPGMRSELTARLQKHIFPMDDVAVSDVTDDTRMFTLLGPHAHEIVEEWGGKALVDLPPSAHTVLSFESAPVVAYKSSGLGQSVPGWTFIVAEAAAAEFWRRTALKGAVPMGTESWEAARIANGVPAAGSELTDLYNPHEAGLLHAVSLAKGCYVGQETLAKLYNTNGVKQQLWGLQLPRGCECRGGDSVAASEEADAPRMGIVTSCTQTANGPFALAYLRCKKRGEQIPLAGITVFVHGTAAKVVDLPAATRQLPPGAVPSAKQEADESIAEDLDAKAQAKAEKLRQMQERMAAWQQSQASQQQKASE